MKNVRCANCQASDSIASVDEYIGTCEGSVTVTDGKLDFEPHGYTEIHWDSCNQIGWSCRSCFSEEIVQGEKDNLDKALRRLVKIVS